MKSAPPSSSTLVGILLLLGIAAALGAPPAGAAATKAIRVSTPASDVGRWEPHVLWPIGASHAMVLATGKVLLFAPPTSGEHEDLIAKVWNPETGKFRDVSWERHIHCSGHSFLADGSVFVAGGHTQELCKTQGLRETNVFDPFTHTWVAMSPMRHPRYYPTTLTLGDGRVLILSGFGDSCAAIRVMEIFDPASGSFKLLREEPRHLHLYPRVHLLPDGDVAYVGPQRGTWIFPTEGGQWEKVTETLYGERRHQGTNFPLPGEPYGVMICGGYSELESNPTETCERISFGAEKPRWAWAASMRFPRGHANVVVLPDGTALMVGGATEGDEEGPILNAELYDPETNRWRLVPAQRKTRAHHSIAVLLPDGRVLSSSESEGPASAELYRPPYLFRGKRPAIKRAPGTIDYRKAFSLKAKQAKRIDSVVLVRPSAVTHSVNSSQRLVELEFTSPGGRRLQVRGPRSSNHAPPGYYMLFVLNDRGVPSKARMVHLLPAD